MEQYARVLPAVVYDDSFVTAVAGEVGDSHAGGVSRVDKGLELRDARRAAEGFSALSLDAPLSGEDDPSVLRDLVGEDDAQVDQAVDMEAVASHWSELPRREQRILILRFYGNLTQDEIAGLGISQMHVSRLQAHALARLRYLVLDPARPSPARGETA